ncbi:MAG TPA: DUF3783 domain-containing protein [Smithella sp.]|nr:DUF3783 domain-containing protein [Smithella sp.]
MKKMDRIICFSVGLSAQDIEQGRASFEGMNRQVPILEVIAVTQPMLGWRVGDVLDGMIEGSEGDTHGERKALEIKLSPPAGKYRVVIVHTQERDLVLQVMRSFKAVLPDPQNIIFAVITETALNWTFEDYIGHLGKEHESMQNRRTENNPDLKKI